MIQPSIMSVVEQLVEDTSNEVIDTHGLTFYLFVRQDVDRVVGGSIRNLQDTEISKLRRTLSISQFNFNFSIFI